MNASNSTRHKLVVAVDGPSGSGKSSVSREAAKKLDFNFLDTGAMYRMITLYLLRSNVHNELDIQKILDKNEIDLSISINPLEILFQIKGEDVSKEIRSEEITKNVSFYASLPEVRNFLVQKQRDLINDSNKSIVIEGRDIGSVVVPDADVKIFITASEEIRAQRRAKEINSDVKKVLTEQKIRDEKDSNRKISPLLKPNDSKELDTSSLSFDQSVNKFIEIVKNV
ncbi:MAG: Cytidylate kinase [Actinomycetota bacterium]